MSQVSKFPQPPAGPLLDAYRKLHEVYVETSIHREAIDAIRRLFTAADVMGSYRGLALVGPSGTGKTSAVRHAERWLRAHASLAPDSPSPLPIGDMTAATTPKGLVTLVLTMGRDPLAPRGSFDDRHRRLSVVGPSLDVHGLAFDEFHHAFERRNQEDDKKMKSALKAIVNSVPRPIILMGTDELDAALDELPEVRNRVRRRVYMRDPTVSSLEDLKDMRDVLMAMNAVLPCGPDCDLAGVEMMLRVLLAADSQFGAAVDLVRRACLIGAIEGATCMQLKHLCAAYRESAKRQDRADERNPFLMPIDVVKKLLTQRRTPVPA